MHRSRWINSRRVRAAHAGALLLASLCLGCQTGLPDRATIVETFDVRDRFGWKTEEELPPPQIPSRLVATWTHAVRHTPGMPAERGFGGRIVFFGRDMNDPVRVDGQLVVYAFDEEGRKQYETHPTKRFIFRREDLPAFEGTSQLGPSYSVWIPWDIVGGKQKNISLIARFEPAGGPILVGEQTRHLLPGASQQIAEAAAMAENGRSILLTGHSEQQEDKSQSDAPADDQNGVFKASSSGASTTIQLPESVKQRLQRIRTDNVKLREIKQRAARSNASKSSGRGNSTNLQQRGSADRREKDDNATAANSSDKAETPAALATSIGGYVHGRPARGVSTGATHEAFR